MCTWQMLKSCPCVQAQDQLRILEQLDKRLRMLEVQARRLRDAAPSKDQQREGQAVEKRYVAAVRAAERELMQMRWLRGSEAGC